MLRLEFRDVTTFRDIVDAISELLSEGNFVVDSEGLKFKATDPTMVTLVEMFYSKDNFERYELEGKEMNLMVNIELLKKFLKKVKKEEKVSFIVEKENMNRLVIDIEGKTKKTFSLPLLDSEIQQIPELNLEFNGEAEILSGVLSDVIEDASLISDVVSFKFEDDALIVGAESELTSMNAKFTKESEGVIDIKIKSNCVAKYSIEYLKKIMKGKKISGTVVLSLNTDAPAKFYFKEDGVWMSYIVAPRVEE